MIYELKVINIPHEKANDEFRTSFLNFLGIENAQLVHYQQKDNQKVLLLRLNDLNVLQDLLVKGAITFNNQEILLENYQRDNVKRINSILSRRKKQDPEDDEMIAKVYLSNIPYNTTEEELFDVMSKFGHISQVEVIKKDKGDFPGKARRKRKQPKCRFAVVHYHKFEEAVAAFYVDKIKIGRRNIKVKLFLPKEGEVEDNSAEDRRQSSRILGSQIQQKVEKSPKAGEHKPGKSMLLHSLEPTGSNKNPESPTITRQSPMILNRNHRTIQLKSFTHATSASSASAKASKFRFKEKMKLPLTEKNHSYNNLRLNGGAPSRNVHLNSYFMGRNFRMFNRRAF